MGRIHRNTIAVMSVLQAISVVTPHVYTPHDSASQPSLGGGGGADVGREGRAGVEQVLCAWRHGSKSREQGVSIVTCIGRGRSGSAIWDRGG